MKAPSPAFSLYPKDILSDEHCSAMTNEEFGAYVRLLMHAWLEGSVPADPVKLARLLRVRHQAFRRIWPALQPCFQERENRLFQSRLERERSQQQERSARNSAKGRKGGRPAKSTTEESPGFTAGKPRQSLPSPSPLLSARSNETESRDLANSKLGGASGNGRSPDAIDLPDADERRSRICAKLGRVATESLRLRDQHLDELRDVWLEVVPEGRQKWRLNLSPQTADHDVLLSAERELDDWLAKLEQLDG